MGNLYVGRAGRLNLCWGYSIVLYPVGPTSLAARTWGKSNYLGFKDTDYYWYYYICVYVL